MASTLQPQKTKKILIGLKSTTTCKVTIIVTISQLETEAQKSKELCPRSHSQPDSRICVRRERRALPFFHFRVNRLSGWPIARPHWPSGGSVSDPEAGRTKHPAGPTALSLSHSLGFPSRRTHRHLPRLAAGMLPTSLRTKLSLV